MKTTSTPIHRPAGSRYRARWQAITRVAACAALLLAPGAVAAEPEPDEEQPKEECMDCHEDAEEFFVFPDGSKIDISIYAEPWKKSVHAKELKCRGCHRNIVDHPHPRVPYFTARAYQIGQSVTCKRCHYAHYTRVLDGIHYAELVKGNIKAPTCVDCHGAHDTTDPASPRISVDKRCGKCHAKVAKAYEGSVHGAALLEGDNPDVPVCTDCHGAHAIRDPGLAGFHAGSHEICARCHSDEQRMEPYGLSTAVVSTYLDDFHGRSNQLYAQGAGVPGKPMATCTDCHGVHDIQRFDDGDQGAVRERVIEVCRRCHEDVPEAFASAWLSHYPPTLASAPLVWFVKWTYRILIPVILLGLVLHILLHLSRLRSRR